MIVLIGAGSVGKTTMSKHLHDVLKYDVFCLDDFLSGLKHLSKVEAVSKINERLIYLIESSKGNLIVDIGSLTLIDLTDEQRKSLKTIFGDADIIHLKACKSKDKSKKFIFNQISQMYPRMSDYHLEPLFKSITEDIDSNVYKEFCNLEISILTNEDLDMTPREYERKIYNKSLEVAKSIKNKSENLIIR